MSDQDPAVDTWHEAMTQTTSARLRAALEANHELAWDHAQCVIRIHVLRRQLELAHAEIEQLKARLAGRYSTYHLTDQGRAALAAEPTDQGDPIP